MNKLTTIEREKISNQKHFANELSFNKYLSSVEAVDMITNITGVNISNPKFEEVIEDKK
ncbi:MAG: hypothetical protein GQ557_01585, partial [Mycoplasmataceae bacterium]|nr:hypothetical protein [Mycoplasmataceae bacterium]